MRIANIINNNWLSLGWEKIKHKAKDSVCNACECFHAKKSSANRYDTNQAKVWTANPYVNHKVEVNTEIFTRQPYWLLLDAVI